MLRFSRFKFKKLRKKTHITDLSVAKVCEHLGLVVNLKIRLELGVCGQWDEDQV